MLLIREEKRLDFLKFQSEIAMICEIHKKFFPQKRCPLCEEEYEELEHAARMAEIENKVPIVLWEGKK